MRRRLLLCLYGLGTNAGLKRLAVGRHGFSYKELLHTHRRYIDAESVRDAARRVANATLTVRDPRIWGEGTTACASDSKHFGAFDQNLMTEWHARYGGRGVMIYWHVIKQLEAAGGTFLRLGQSASGVDGRRLPERQRLQHERELSQSEDALCRAKPPRWRCP